MVESFFRTYIRKPFYLLIHNWTIFLLFLVFLLVATISDKYISLDLSLSSSAVFTAVPNLFRVVLGSSLILGIFLVVSLFKTYLMVGIGKDMMGIFTKERKGLVGSLRAITWNNFLWFLGIELLIYVVFNAIAVTFYTICYYMWIQTGWEILPVTILFGAFAFFYPLFYFCFSWASMVCVFPLSNTERWKLIHYFLHWGNLKRTYVFYAVRLSVEYLFLFILPFVFIYFFKNALIAKYLALFGLLLPLLLLRGSAYTFKLRVLKDHPDVRALFARYFESK